MRRSVAPRLICTWCGLRQSSASVAQDRWVRSLGNFPLRTPLVRILPTMAPYVSYRRLIDNSVSALVGGIEIYNKPRFSYRDEVVVILLTNAWELMLKAILAKTRSSIHYRKKRGEPYRTVTWQDAANRCRAQGLWPVGVDYDSTRENIRAIADYRDSAVHLYNVGGFSQLVHALCQQSIINYRDVLYAVFGRDLSQEITWHLLPLGNAAPTDQIEFLGPANRSDADAKSATLEFLKRLRDALDRLETAGADVSRVATTYDVTLQSVKKIEAADIVLGVDASGTADRVFIKQRSDPNQDFPFTANKLIMAVNKRRKGRRINTRDYQAVAWRFNLRDDVKKCWVHLNTKVPQYSSAVVDQFVNMTDDELSVARSEYSAYQRDARRSATTRIATTKSNAG